MSIDVSVKAFEGPLDLLLSLIKDKQIDIYDIPIAEITAAYLEELKNMESSNYEVAAEFVVMAATLMEIKARMLLPKAKIEEEEEEEDPRTELVNKLLIYKQFKEAANFLKESFEDQSRVFARDTINRFLLEELKPDHDLRNLGVSISDLLGALRVVLEAKKEEEEILPVLPREKITIDEQINWLTLYMKEKRDLLFSDLFGVLKSKVLIVVTFMALLELVHKGTVSVRQSEDLEIYVSYIENGGESEEV